MEPLIALKDVHKSYAIGPRRVEVLHHLDLAIPRGGFVALMGPSGSGKTTLLNLVSGLDKPTSGSVTIGGQRIDALGNRALAKWRARNVGLVFQHYNLMPMLNARQNVELPLLLTDLSASRIRQNAEVALQLVGLSERAQHRPRELSGGQQQRVAIARAIVSDPPILICDEPTGDLDRRSADEIMELLRTLNRQYDKTVIMVTHDPKAAGYAGLTLHLDKGTLVEAVAAQ